MTSGLKPAFDIFSSGLNGYHKIAWVLIAVLIIAGGIAITWWIKKIKAKKNQWTHKLKIRRVLQNGFLTDPVTINMRRFPLIKRAEVFELEKALLGSYLFPEVDEYSGHNEYSIILDKNNRIYINRGEKFTPNKEYVEVSARHAEIDIQISNLKSNFQNINKVNKRLEWGMIAKYGVIIIGIISLTIMGIVAMQKWGDAQQYKSQEAQSMAIAMQQLSEAMTTVQATVNTQKLEITPMLKKLYGTNNLQSIINGEILLNGTIQT